MALLLFVSFSALLSHPDPATNTDAIVDSHHGVRVSVLSEGLFRLQLGPPYLLDDRPSLQVVNRNLPVPNYQYSDDPVTHLFDVHTDIARIAIQDNSSVLFQCSLANHSWSWNFGSSPSATDTILSNMPVNRYGMYVLNDSLTARLGEPAANDISWWEYPRYQNSNQQPPNFCTEALVGKDVGPGAVRSSKYPNGLTNQTQESCCLLCSTLSSTNECKVWIFDPSAAQGDVNCYLMSSFKSVITREERVLGGDLDQGKSVALDLYFMCYGHDFPLATRQLASITGPPPLMPLAAYGVYYSGCCLPELYTQKAVEQDLLQQYKNLDLPLDVFILDFFWHRRGPWGGYSWDKKDFPDGNGLVASLRNGSNPYGTVLKLLNNHHPDQAIINNFTEDRYAEFASAMGVNPALNKSFNCNFYDRDYVTALQNTLLSPVNDYPWIDCVSCSSRAACGDNTAPENLDFNLWTNYAFNSLLARENKRSIVLNRVPGHGDLSNYNGNPLNGTALIGVLGAHRYPTAWTGDGPKLVDGVSLFPAASAGHLWVTYSADLGPYVTPDPPKYVRFMQWGVWSPIFRPHDGGNQDTRIWKFQEPYYSILRDMTRLRGSLVPYLYSLAYSVTLTQVPFLRPMWWDYPELPSSWNMQDQYFFGEILVNPTTNTSNASVSTTWLPNGTWLSWNGTQTLLGGETVEKISLLSDMIVYVPNGYVVPMWIPGRRTTSVGIERDIMWTLWLSKSAASFPSNGSGVVYNDDGDTLNYTRGLFGNTTFSYLTKMDKSNSTTVNIDIIPENKVYLESLQVSRRNIVQIRGGFSIQTVVADGVRIAPSNDPGNYQSIGWWVQTTEHAEAAVTATATVLILPSLDIAKSTTITLTLL
eukprot:m.130909 g.130909  ORF g.130909 m.130909 type:complete len:871 (-) comp14610_c0_seq11:30-2642(-)